MGWIDIEKELSEFSSMLISMKQDAKNKHIKWEYDSFREEYEELKSSLKAYLQEESKHPTPILAV